MSVVNDSLFLHTSVAKSNAEPPIPKSTNLMVQSDSCMHFQRIKNWLMNGKNDKHGDEFMRNKNSRSNNSNWGHVTNHIIALINLFFAESDKK